MKFSRWLKLCAFDNILQQTGSENIAIWHRL